MAYVITGVVVMHIFSVSFALIVRRTTKHTLYTLSSSYDIFYTCLKIYFEKKIHNTKNDTTKSDSQLSVNVTLSCRTDVLTKRLTFTQVSVPSEWGDAGADGPSSHAHTRRVLVTRPGYVARLRD